MQFILLLFFMVTYQVSVNSKYFFYLKAHFSKLCQLRLIKILKDKMNYKISFLRESTRLAVF
jgi:hypothetical protein